MRSLLLALTLTGCGFEAGLHRTHEGLKTMSREVEPVLAKECMRRARVCVDRNARAPADCPELLECRSWKRNYAMALKQIHQGLGVCSKVHGALKDAKVIK